VFEPENIRYLTGFETLGFFTPIAAVVTPWKLAIVCREFELSNVDATAVDADGIGYDDDADPVAVVRRVVPAKSRVGWDLGPSGWSRRDIDRLGSVLGEPPVDIGPAVYRMRMVKSATELALLRRAAAITISAVAAASEACSGATWEREVAAVAYRTLVLAGSNYPSSPTYIVSGPRSAQAHVTWKPDAHLSHDIVFLEIGGCVERYTAPLMRTGLGLSAPDRLRRLADGAVDLLRVALESIRPGVPAASVELAVRERANALGISDALRHRIGYSVGVSFPQGWGEPHVLALRAGEPRLLESGMVFHVVSHLIDARLGGVGVSSTVCVSPDGREVLTSADPPVFEYA
jgi:Xaa-Pro dipeptidase